MKNILGYFTLLLIAAGFMACANGNEKNGSKEDVYTEMKKAGWLIGEWHSNSPLGDITETWTKKDDSSYIGISYFIYKNDTVSTENIRLEQRGNDLFYTPVLKSQNKGLPVKFTLTVLTDTSIVFENPKHDFPQRISYTRLHKDSLLAEVSRINEAPERTIKFPMKKIR